MTKWLPDVVPTDLAVDVAARSLRIRLAAVCQYLRRAVKLSDEPENFHQLRVWARRSEAALDLYDDLLPRRRARRLRKTLRRVRRAAGRVRDCDVFGKRTAGAPEQWPADLRDERKRAHEKLVDVYERVGRAKRLQRRVDKLVDRLVANNADSRQKFADRARETLLPIAAGFFGAAPDDACEEEALHKFRLAGKDLRYAMELLAPAFAAPFRDELYPVLSTLQEKLGQVNDVAAAQRRLDKRIDESGNAAELSELRRRHAAAGEDLVRARNEFQRWWSPPMREGLRARFEELLGPLSMDPRA